VCIKVDREERPDVDSIYMQATQLMTGHGGWPMTVFLTPECVPYYAGTYFPPEPRHGMPSFRQLLESMADAFKNRRGDVEENARRMHEALQKMADARGAEHSLDRTTLDTAATRLGERFDARHGGFGNAPKFPQPMNMSFLLRHYKRTRNAKSLGMVTLTLRKMMRGGIYDHLGGGFARYSVDEYWLVPHFEKMLYDNALLAGVLVEAWQASGDDDFKRVAGETIDYVLRDMTGPEGGFYATEDADSEGEEGKFYVWKPAELARLLGEQTAKLVCDYYDVGPHGNFEHGNSILNIPNDPDVVAARNGMKLSELEPVVAQARERMLWARSKRVRPGRDEKIITAWNGLMLEAIAKAAAAFRREDYLEAARRNAAFVLEKLSRREGGHLRLLRVHKDGASKLNAYLEDYGALANGLLSLYEASLEAGWYEAARDLAASMLDLFEDEHGGFFFTSKDHEQLITRVKDDYDNATPAGTSLAVMALLRLWAFTGEDRWRLPAERVLRQMKEYMVKAPGGFGMLLCGLDFALADPLEIVLVGEDEAMRAATFRPFLPNKVVAGGEADIPLLQGKTLVDGKPAAYVCQRFTCQAPALTAEALARQLE